MVLRIQNLEGHHNCMIGSKVGMVLRIQNLEGHQNCMIGSKVLTILMTFCVHDE